MRIAILMRPNALEASLNRQTRQPIMLIDVDGMNPADRDAFLDGDDAVLTRYGFEPYPLYISAIVISVHPECREDAVDIAADMDDEQFERMERQRELEKRRRKREAAERAQLAAIEAARAEQEMGLPSARRMRTPHFLTRVGRSVTP